METNAFSSENDISGSEMPVNGYLSIKRSSLFRMRTALLGTIYWGILETTILNIVWWIDKHIWPQFHSRFMRFLHGSMGGIVTPSIRELERSHDKRNYDNRTKLERVSGSPFLKHNDAYILPTQEVLSILLRSNMRSTVAYCFCRLQKKRNSGSCDINAPLQTCLTLSFPQPVEQLNYAEPKPELVAKEREIYNLLKKCEEIGLVHQVIFYKKNSTYVICNCCPCCCEVLAPHFEGIKQQKFHKRKIERFNELKNLLNAPNSSVAENSEILTEYKTLKKNIKMHRKGAKLEPTPLVINSVFIAVHKDNIECINCGKCVSRCYFGARTFEIVGNGLEAEVTEQTSRPVRKKVVYNPSKCVGCGLCVVTCPQDLIYLEKRSKVIKLNKKNRLNPLKKAIKHTHPHA